jgi:hypothetical protein
VWVAVGVGEWVAVGVEVGRGVAVGVAVSVGHGVDVAVGAAAGMDVTAAASTSGVLGTGVAVGGAGVGVGVMNGQVPSRLQERSNAVASSRGARRRIACRSTPDLRRSRAYLPTGSWRPVIYRAGTGLSINWYGDLDLGWPHPEPIGRFREPPVDVSHFHRRCLAQDVAHDRGIACG